MRMLVAMLLVIGAATGNAIDEYTLATPIPMPAVQSICLSQHGNGIIYNAQSRVWKIDLDAVMTDGSVRGGFATVEVSQDEVYAALAATPVPATWNGALVAFQTALRGLAIQKALAR